MDLDASCIEVTRGDTLRGYAIFFRGGWDAYLADGRHSLLRVGANYASRDGALKAVRIGYDWRKEQRENEP